MPYDYFSIGLAEVLLRAGKKEEGMKLIDDITGYAGTYLDYAITIRPENRFGMDYMIGVNMQAMLDVYNMSEKLGFPEIKAKIEPDLNKYYGQLFSNK
jgi:hypothetical protein